MMNEDDNERVAQRVQAVKTKEALERLLASEGWHILKAIAEDRKTKLEQEVLHRVLEDGNSVYRQEFMKGQGYGILLFLQLPLVEIQSCQAILDVIPPEDEDKGVG